MAILYSSSTLPFYFRFSSFPSLFLYPFSSPHIPFFLSSCLIFFPLLPPPFSLIPIPTCFLSVFPSFILFRSSSPLSFSPLSFLYCPSLSNYKPIFLPLLSHSSPILFFSPRFLHSSFFPLRPPSSTSFLSFCPYHSFQFPSLLLLLLCPIFLLPLALLPAFLLFSPSSSFPPSSSPFRFPLVLYLPILSPLVMRPFHYSFLLHLTSRPPPPPVHITQI